jgi:hypothetical protein
MQVSTEINGLYTHCSKCLKRFVFWPCFNTVLNARTHMLQYCRENGCSLTHTHTHTHIHTRRCSGIQYCFMASCQTPHISSDNFSSKIFHILRNGQGLQWSRTLGHSYIAALCRSLYQIKFHEAKCDGKDEADLIFCKYCRESNKH